MTALSGGAVFLCIIAAYIGWFMGKDPSQLAGVVVGLVGALTGLTTAYCAANVWADSNYRKFSNGTGNSTSGGDDGG